MTYEPLYTAEEMRAAEAAHPGPTLELMERAGKAVADEILGRFPDARRVAVWCGGGANGGDGLVVATELLRAGREPAVRLLGAEEKVAGDAAVVLGRAREAGVPFVAEHGAADLAVDALFGTGFSGKPRPEAEEAIGELNAGSVPVVAVDLPSGVDASTGMVAGAAVEAALTVTFHAPKVGHAVAPGRFHAGEVVVADIGLEGVPTRLRRATAGILADVPRRTERDNKYSAGAVLVVGGSRGLTGAPSLTSEAALRAGAGIVVACVPASLNLVFEQRLVEVMTRPCPDEEGALVPDAADEILAAAERAGAVALGPGLGRTDGTRALVGFLLDRLDKPVVLDADGLWALAGHLDWVFSRDAPTVLTPHAGELGQAPRAALRLGRAPTGSTPCSPARTTPARSCSSRGRTRWSPRRAATRSSSTWGTRASPPPGAATCSRASSARSSPRGWRGASPRPPRRRPAGSPRRSRPSVTGRRG